MGERLQKAAKLHSATVLRTTALIATALQLVFIWALPLMYGDAPEVVRRVGNEAGRNIVVAWATTVAIGHLLAIRWPLFQRSMGLLHGFGCLMLAFRLLKFGLPWNAMSIVSISLFGFALAITSPGRRGWR